MIKPIEPYKAGEYTFTIGDRTNMGDYYVKVTDSLGTDSGHFFFDLADGEESFKAAADAYLKEMEDPIDDDLYSFPPFVWDPIFGRIV